MKMLFHNLLAILLVTYQISLCYSTEDYSMNVIEAYDDIRLLAQKSFKPNEQAVTFLDSLFSNLSDSSIKTLSAKHDEAYDTEQNALVLLKATESIVKSSYADSYQNYKIPTKYCQNQYSSQKCDSYYPYRTLDGSCNNLVHNWYGAAGTPYKRILKHDYDDGYNAIKEKSVVDGYYLPSARLVAITLHRERPTKSVWSNFMISFGQMVTHDMAKTYRAQNPDRSDLWCSCFQLNENCYNIPIPNNDYFYAKENKLKCLPFTRNMASYNYHCNYGPREQMNKHSHFIDLSVIYTSNPHLRAYYGGLLSFSVNKHGEVTFKLAKQNGCQYSGTNVPMYHTGDVDSEQNIYLHTNQIVWLRNHNQLAENLHKLNPYWNDETIFQQARRINIAMYQHVIYNEYLPSLLGYRSVKLYDLEPLTWGYYNKYNQDIYPNLANVFVTAAFRHHFLVNEHHCYADDKFRKFGCHQLGLGILNSTDTCYATDAVIRGEIIENTYYSTPQVNWNMNNVLLKKYDSIAAINIQRGRDHGIHGYNHYRELCGLNRAKSFDELYNIPPAVRSYLKKLYYHVDDIDLWSGGSSELPVTDGFVGHTFTCLIAKQFSDLRRGDRFYYENGNSAISFTPEQLDFIRSTTMASIICRNVEAWWSPKWTFLEWHPKTNPFIDCNKLAYGSLVSFKDHKQY